MSNAKNITAAIVVNVISGKGSGFSSMNEAAGVLNFRPNHSRHAVGEKIGNGREGICMALKFKSKKKTDRQQQEDYSSDEIVTGQELQDQQHLWTETVFKENIVKALSTESVSDDEEGWEIVVPRQKRGESIEAFHRREQQHVFIMRRLKTINNVKARSTNEDGKKETDNRSALFDHQQRNESKKTMPIKSLSGPCSQKRTIIPVSKIPTWIWGRISNQRLSLPCRSSNNL